MGSDHKRYRFCCLNLGCSTVAYCCHLNSRGFWREPSKWLVYSWFNLSHHYTPKWNLIWFYLIWQNFVQLRRFAMRDQYSATLHMFISKQLFVTGNTIAESYPSTMEAFRLDLIVVAVYYWLGIIWYCSTMNDFWVLGHGLQHWCFDKKPKACYSAKIACFSWDL